MLSRYRYALIGLALLGLGVSVTALVVHYRLMTDPGYSSFCDISATVSCQQVLESSYATVKGIPIASGGAIWSTAVLLLAFWGMRQPSSELAGRVAGYIFVLATAGLAVVFYYGYASFFKLGAACPICMAMYAAVAGIFLVSAAAATSLTAIPARLGEDLTGLTKSQSGTTLAVAWVAASIALLVLFPRPDAFGSQAASTVDVAPETPIETLTPEQTAEWDKYLDSRVPVTEAGVLPSGTAKVLLIKFNDYQCPSCRQAYILYKDIIAKYEAAYPGVFRYESRDFPLESECGAGGVHAAACEAAVAVRLAKEKNLDKQLEATLFDRQSMSMTRDDVKAALREVTKISDSEFDSRYPKMLEAVKQDVELGQKVGVSGTPTFFINGIKLGGFRPAAFDAVIAYELKKAGVTS